MHVIFSPPYEFMYRMFFLYSREIKDKITCDFNSVFRGYLYFILRMSIGLKRGLSLRLMINMFQVSLLFKRLVVTDAIHATGMTFHMPMYMSSSFTQ